MQRIYLDNNATTLVDPRVAAAMEPFFVQMYGNPNSLHRFGTETHPEMLKALDRIYAGINAEDDADIVINGCATEGNNTVLKHTLAIRDADPRKDTLITSAVEHPSIAHTCDYLESKGMRVIRLLPNSEGLITLEALKSALEPDRTAMVSIMWANNETGLINPMESIARYCRENDVLIHSDGVQAVGKIPVDVQKVPLDYFTLSAHKFHGPKGVGALYIRKGRSITPLLHGGEHMGGLRSGTVNVPFMVGMGLAMELAVSDLEAKQTHIRAMRDRLEDALLTIPDTSVIGDRRNRTPNTILVSFRGIEGEAFIWDMNQKGIAVSTGSACSSEDLEPDATLQAMDVAEDLTHTGVRISLSRFTTDEEIDLVIDAVQSTVQRLRAISSTY